MSTKTKQGNKEVEILFHTISYYYDNNQVMPEREEEHVKEMINNGYKAGELSYLGTDSNEEIRGWWSIVFN